MLVSHEAPKSRADGPTNIHTRRIEINFSQSHYFYFSCIKSVRESKILFVILNLLLKNMAFNSKITLFM